jgi:uracil-DNA glycosylase family 4
VGYAMLGYWTAWAKCYYPTDFICACLNHGGEANKQSYIDEAVRLNLNIISPKVGISSIDKWEVKENKIYIPFIEIKGIGEKTAKQCVPVSRKKTLGFFATETKQEAKTKVQKILDKIGAYDLASNKICPDYFKFTVQNNINLKISELVFPGYEDNFYFSKCTSCLLCKERINKPVYPSRGWYGVAIVGEAPGWNEDKRGKGFVGRSGKLLFETLRNFKCRREYFHVTNVCKCYPSRSKTPNPEQIKTCSEKWLKEELEKIKCSLILCVGGSAMFALTGREGGITKMNGKVEFNAKYNCYICYVIHPAAVLRNPNQKGDFEKGIESFVEVFKKGIG